MNLIQLIISLGFAQAHFLNSDIGHMIDSDVKILEPNERKATSSVIFLDQMVARVFDITGLSVISLMLFTQFKKLFAVQSLSHGEYRLDWTCVSEHLCMTIQFVAGKPKLIILSCVDIPHMTFTNKSP